MENRQDNFQQFSDDSIRRFLLGQLPASEQAIFEERLFTDGELEGRVRLAEFELADEFAFKRLPASEAQSFRERYLLTADRNHKVNVSQAIRERFMPLSISAAKPAMSQRLMAMFDLRRPVWRYAFAAAILILILGTVFLVTKEPQIVRRFIPDRFKSKPHMSPTPQLMNHSTTSSSPAHVEQSQPEPPHELPLTVSLTATTALDQAPLVTLPAGENASIRFQLSIAEDGGSYRGDLLTASDETLFSAESLKPYGTGPSAIDFEVPARVLKSGQYQIRLVRVDDTTKQEGSQYYFRVQ
jgi:hypothetical protein